MIQSKKTELEELLLDKEPTYGNSSSMIAALKELYSGSTFTDLVYTNNSFLNMVNNKKPPKTELEELLLDDEGFRGFSNEIGTIIHYRGSTPVFSSK